MRVKLLASLVLSGLLTLGLLASVGAQEAGNPVVLTPQGQFSLGWSMAQVFEQKHGDYDLRAANSATGTTTDQFSGKFEGDQYQLLELTYGLRDWCNVFAQAGLAQGGKFLSADANSGQEWESKLEDVFVWALGAKARAFKLGNGLALGLAARYLRYDDRKLGHWHENQSGYDDSVDSTADLKLDYWQVDLTAVLSLHLGPVTPYAGLGYTYSEAKESGRNYNLRNSSYVDYDATLRNQDQLAALCGLNLALGQGFSFYLQGEFVARTALGLGLSWSF